MFSPWAPQRLSVGWLDMVSTTLMVCLDLSVMLGMLPFGQSVCETCGDFPVKDHHS